jgi:hypothetical protein
MAEFDSNSILTAPDDFTGDGHGFLIVGDRKCHDDFLAAEKIIGGFDKYAMRTDIQDVSFELAPQHGIIYRHQTGFSKASAPFCPATVIRAFFQLFQQCSLLLIRHIDDQFENVGAESILEQFFQKND